MSKNEIAKQEMNGYMMLKNFSLGEAMADELTGLDGGFERIKIPSAGSTVFEVPGEEPDQPDTVKEFSAVILYHHPLHSFYRDKYTGGNNPPDCGSYDGVNGNGTPGGACASCPYNQFGSGDNGSKACKNRRRIYVLREGEIFPMLLSLPTGSLKEYGKFIKRLLGKGMKSNAVVTRFTLKKAVNSGGITYSQAAFSVDRPLTDAEYTLIEPLTEQMKAYSRRVGYENESASEGAYTIDPETGEIQ